MSQRKLACSFVAAGLAVLAFSASAAAHIRLLDPLARYEIQGFETGIKSCPCGSGNSNRTCDVARDGSDANRSTDRVSRFEAGSTITLRFEEFVDHTGSFRVAFDPEGADFADFNANVLVPIVPDPPGGAGNTGDGAIWEIQVKLPDTPCENCTLQLLQAMHGDMVNPVTDPSNISSYYSCVDLELVAPGTLGAADPGEPPAPDTPQAGASDGAMSEAEGTVPANPGAKPEGEGTGGAGNGGVDTGKADDATATSNAASGANAGSMGTSLGGVSPMGDARAPGGASTAAATGAAQATASMMSGLAPQSGAPVLGNGMGSDSESSGGCSMSVPRSSPLTALVALGLVSGFAMRRRRHAAPPR
jgi:hypothetical protein